MCRENVRKTLSREEKGIRAFGVTDEERVRGERERGEGDGVGGWEEKRRVSRTGRERERE